MKKTRAILFFVGIFALCFSVPNIFAQDIGMQASTRVSSVSIEEGLIGLKIDLGSFAITPRIGFGVEDPEHGDTIFLFTAGSSFDYYFFDGQLRPYVGGDVFLDFVDAEDSDLSLTLNPHVGAEYWLSEQFSIGGNIGLQFGFGDYMGSEVRFGTTSMMHVTYYF